MGSAIEELCPHTIVSCEEADVLVDVSHPEALPNHLCNKPIVIGSTGHSPSNFEAMEKQALTSPVVYAPNFSLGIALLQELIETVQTYTEIDESHIVDIHHSEKRDAPSGTALQLAKLLDGCTIDSIRDGDVVGEHRVCLKFGDEEIELRHKAKGRSAFARGALHAIEWIAGQPPGLYSMEDVLCQLCE